MPTPGRINARAVVARFSANGVRFAARVSCLHHQFCLHIIKSMSLSFKMKTQFNSNQSAVGSLV